MKKNSIVPIVGILSSMTSIYASETPLEKLNRQTKRAEQRAERQKSDAGLKFIRGVEAGAMGTIAGDVVQRTANFGQEKKGLQYSASRIMAGFKNARSALATNGTSIVNNYKNFSGQFRWPSVARFGQTAKWGSLAYLTYQPFSLWYKSNRADKELEKKVNTLQSEYNKQLSR